MKEYLITYRRNDMPPEGALSCTIKWAHDEKEAVRYLLKQNPSKDGSCVFKRGGTGKIVSVEQLNKQ
jgi:hypothetical protein|tara:strand:- start:238 stop:438 length:201 start_codon:yes stop_codon:yes gene_type:complete